ncbi:NrsF family protein [soil metagenome]
MTDDLIDRLSRDLQPADTGRVARRLTLATFVGVAAALFGVMLLIGLRPDMPQALATRMFWMKLAYTAGLGALGLWAAERLSRPAGDPARRLPWIVLPLAAMAAMAIMQLGAAPAEMRRPLIMCGSALVCSVRRALTAAPVFIGLIWAMRGLAPTRLRLAGATAGLAAGGFGAAIYALHCPEVGAPFVALWYTLGVVAPAALGALVGPRLLRW